MALLMALLSWVRPSRRRSEVLVRYMPGEHPPGLTFSRASHATYTRKT